MKHLLTLLLLCFFSLSSYTQCQIDYSKFEQTPHFEEQFNDTLNGFWDRWKPYYGWGNTNNASNIKVNPLGELGVDINGNTIYPFGGRKNIIDVYNKDNIEVYGGAAHLKIKKLQTEKHKTYPGGKVFDYKYEGALLRTDIGDLLGCEYGWTDGNGVYHPPSYFEGWRYGLFEIECEIPNNKDYYSSFWLLGAHSSDKELDIFEFDSDKRSDIAFYNTIHWWPYDTIHLTNKVHFDYKPDLMTTTHKWSVLWTPTKVVYYLDGIELNTVHQQLVDYDPTNTANCRWNNVDILLSLTASKGAYWNVPFDNRYEDFDENLEFKVNWVKIWKPLDNYDGLDEPPLGVEDMNPNITNVKASLIPYQNKVFYRGTDNKLKGLTFSNNSWLENFDFLSIPHTIKSDPVVSNYYKIYFKGNANKLYNIYKSGGLWHHANIGGNQQIKDKFYLSKMGSTSEIVYTSMDRTLKHFFWDGSSWQNVFLINYLLPGKKANENFIVRDDFIFYESRKQIWPYWFRDKHLWAYKKGTAIGHKFPYEIYTEGSSFTVKNFEATEDGKKLFYISKTNQLRYHQYNNTTQTWQEDIVMNNSVHNVYDNLTVVDNGNRVFYTNQGGNLYNFYKTSSGWQNSIIGYQFVEDIVYDEQNDRIYFHRKGNGLHKNELQYYEWQTNSNVWAIQTPINSNHKIKGMLKPTQNDQIVFASTDNRAWFTKVQESCSERVYDNESVVKGYHSNKNDDITTSIFSEEDETGSAVEYHLDENGELIEDAILQIYPDKYVALNTPLIDLQLIKKITPNPSPGIFHVLFKDTVLVENANERLFQIIRPSTSEVVKEFNIPVSEKSVTFDLSLEPDGMYFIKLFREDDKIENNIILKIK